MSFTKETEEQLVNCSEGKHRLIIESSRVYQTGSQDSIPPKRMCLICRMEEQENTFRYDKLKGKPKWKNLTQEQFEKIAEMHLSAAINELEKLVEKIPEKKNEIKTDYLQLG